MLLLLRCEITYDFWAKLYEMVDPTTKKRDCEAMTTNICLDVVAQTIPFTFVDLLSRIGRLSFFFLDDLLPLLRYLK